MNSINKTARMAGFWYLIFIAFSIFIAPIQSRLVTTDAASTAANILASEGLYRLGFVLDILSAVFFFLAAWSLFVLLKPVNKNLALLFMLLNLGGVAVQCLNDLFLFAPVLLLNGSGYLKAFQADQLQALVMFFLDMHKNGFMVAQIFYGAWLFPLGYLVYKSGFLPKFLGILVLADFVCWLAYFFQFFLFPTFTVITYLSFPVGFLAEFGLTLWLLIKGVKEPK
ncbi:MAG TPA: DUF4386 domain-containing protein [Anaerolineales bacterium]|nr:DUF4386 domain-containing protein [Anaerolineales bacterium]